MKEILLDTNAYTRYLAGDEKVLNAIAAAEIVYMSVFVLGELFAGFKGGNKGKQNKQILKSFLEKPTVSIHVEPQFRHLWREGTDLMRI